jgi:PAS domain S-box-containing protein
MKKVNVVVVDQDRSNVAQLEEQLRSLGHHYLTVTQSGDDADQRITQANPQVILLNAHPCRRERLLKIAENIQNGFDTPVILVVNEKDQKYLESSYSNSPYRIVGKPVRDSDLQASLELTLYRHQTEKILQENQQQLQAVLRSSGEGFITFDLRSNINYMNTVAEMLTGWQQDDAFGRNLSEVFTIIGENDQNLIEISELLEKRSKTGPLTEFNILLVSRDGKRIPVRARVSPIRDFFGNMHGGVIAFGNITELQHAIQQAQLQSNRAEALLGIISKLNSQLDLDSVLQALLEETTSAMQVDGAAVVLLEEDSPTLRVVATHSIDRRYRKFKGFGFKLENLSDTLFIKGADPILIVPNLSLIPNFPYPDLIVKEDIHTVALAKLQSEHQLLGALVIFSTNQPREFTPDEQNFLKGLADHASLAITNARLFENIRNSRSRMQYLSKRLVEVQESERRSMARELHDQVGQMLTGLHFSLESGKHKAPKELKVVFEETQELVKEMINQVRNLSLKLLPSMLDDMGLLPTLIWHFEQFTHQTEIQVNFSHANLDQRLPQDIEVTAYRIIQEGLTNSARYAQVKQIDVRVVVEKDVIRLQVIDRGKGFDTEQTVIPRRKFGLIGMRERAYLVGGKLTVKSSPGNGTELSAVLPLIDHLERRKNARESSDRG